MKFVLMLFVTIAIFIVISGAVIAYKNRAILFGKPHLT
jgi:hypothetical protein